MARNRQTIADQLEVLAIHELPEPFGSKLKEMDRLAREMHDEACRLNADLEFTLDGRLLGDLGEIIAKIYFEVELHTRQREGEDGLYLAGNKTVEVKLRSEDSPIWVKKIPGILLALFLSPKTRRWGVVCNGPGQQLLAGVVYDQQHRRYNMTLSKLLAAQQSLPPGSDHLQQLPNPG